MKQRLNFIFYGIALVLVLIPIGMEQSVGRPMQQPWETLMLSVGIVFLILGKLFTIRQKGGAGGAAGSYFHRSDHCCCPLRNDYLDVRKTVIGINLPNKYEQMFIFLLTKNECSCMIRTSERTNVSHASYTGTYQGRDKS